MKKRRIGEKKKNQKFAFNIFIYKFYTKSMCFHKKENRKKEDKIFIAVVIVIIVLGAVFYTAIALKDRDPQISSLPTVPSQPKIDDINAIAESNQSIIEEALRLAPPAVRPIDETDHILGEMDAPLSLIVYSDFECEFSASFSETIKKVKEAFGGDVAVAFRHYPLRFHPNAETAAIASECAAEQGKFWEMHDKLFMDNKNDNMGVEQFKQDAVAIGLDQIKFNQCLEMEKYKDKIWMQFAEGKNYGIMGTPGSFVNGEAMPGDVPFADFTDSAGIAREGMKTIIERYLNDK